MSTQSPRQRRTTVAVVLFSVLVLAVCLGWAVLVQHVTPSACTYDPPPARSQYLHC